MKPRRVRQRGAGLLDPLIAIVILSFGLLGLARFQLAAVAQTTDAQARLSASAAAEDLLTQVRVDVNNATCYQVPAAGACASGFAMEQAQAWTASVQQSLPGLQTATAALSGNWFTVTVTWTGKNGNETRTHVVTTDARP